MSSRSDRWAPVMVGLVVAAGLLAVAGRYGWHRDELYYLAAGLHPAFGYVDQPPLTSLVARVAYELFGDSLVGMRLAPASAGARLPESDARLPESDARLPESDARLPESDARLLASATVAVSAFPLATGHVLSTSTFDLLAWAALSWLLVRALRDGGRAWLPNLAWQSTHGWPRLGMASVIAGPGNGDSAPRWQIVPLQLVMIGLPLVPIWLAGLWSLALSPALRRQRAFAVAYPLLLAGLIVAGGKPYYLMGMYPVLLAAGAAPTLRWVRRRRPAARAALVAAAVLLTGATSVVLVLPLVPVRDLPGTPMAGVQPITEETVGWPELARTVSDVYRALPPAGRADAIVLAGNYGEAGAVDLFRHRLPLPPAYSGHNSYADWGPPPPDSATPVIALGLDESSLRRWFASMRPVARVDNGIGLDNTEQGRTVWLCTGRTAPWSAIWPRLRRLA